MQVADSVADSVNKMSDDESDPKSQSDLYRHRFPSKVGGKPAWLNPCHLPNPAQLQCGQCNRPLKFLAQIYAPLDSSKNTFHRSLFIFCCTDPSCSESTQSVRVFRSQLPRFNPFYSSDPVYLDDDEPYKGVSLCAVCGCLAPQRCGKCHQRPYCSREHQVDDWRNGHNVTCGNATVSPASVPPSTFPELEIANEDEDESDPAQFSQREQELLDQYEAEVKKYNDADRAEHDEFSIKNAASVDDDFVGFQNRIRRAPSQCFRYHRGHAPLWVHSVGKLPDQQQSAMVCRDCQGPVVFELQVMPQLLNVLGDDSLDWGTIAIWTCESSCGSGLDGYVEEHVWRQPPAAPM
ncbi:unnamed protein product (mitochondrion) [Plasmodiophora brassicae]|uniref:MYND-type domain-containing protein n=1 Tax=Plasmodiophora brassicae TaxID=37360 RepID=A0A3P3YM87_PLABS|nr:unnamed protein product [Plasmodiophora brassicae]